MSIEAVTWALRVPVGGNAKVVLLGLANHAHPDGSEAYPALDTLAEYAHCDRSTARRNVRKLVEEGWVVEDGVGPRGQTKYRLPLGKTSPGRGGKTPPVASEPVGGGIQGDGGVAPMPPEPSLGTVQEATPKTRASSSDETVPDDFPDELRPHARIVLPVLRSVAERWNARHVTARSVAHVLMARPRHPIVKAAHDFAAWADGQSPRKDVVAGYRNWLDKCPQLAGVERLPGADGPLPTGVTRLSPKQERDNYRTRSLMEMGGLLPPGESV